MKPRRGKKTKGIVSKSEIPQPEPEVVSEEVFDNFVGLVAMMEETKAELIKALGLPVKDQGELNFAVWNRPYRIVNQVAPTLFLYASRPDPKKPSTLYGTRQILALKRPFKDRPYRIVQTIESEIHTFYILLDENDILPDENDDYKP